MNIIPQNCPWTVLSDRGFVKISGANAEKFLQGQVTCDVSSLAQHDSLLGAHCNPKGRILFTFRMFCWTPSPLTPLPREGERNLQVYWLCLPRSQAEFAVSALKKYAVFSKVIVEDVSSQTASIGFMNKETDISNTKAVISNTEAVIPNAETVIPAQAGIHLSEHHDTKDFLEIFIPGTTPRLQLIGSLEQIQNQIQLLNKDQEVPFSAWKTINIESGIAEIYPETREQFTPHEINYHNLGAVSFDKGCYVGQEIVARMHYLGKLKTSLVRLDMSDSLKELKRGEKILKDNKTSILVDFVVHNEETLILANIQASPH